LQISKAPASKNDASIGAKIGLVWHVPVNRILRVCSASTRRRAMSRTDSRRNKEKRAKRASHERSAAAHAAAAELKRLHEEARERGVELVNFVIVYEAMPDPVIDALPEADRAEIERLGPLVLGQDGPWNELMPSLEALGERCPNVACVWNWMMTVAMKSGDEERSLRLAEEIFRRFPDYIFGISQWVMTLLGRGDIDEATRVLDGRLGLAAWWPERRRYHATEFVTFNSMLGHYFLATGEHKAAGAQFEMIRDILPEHPGVESLQMAVVRTAIGMLHERSKQERAERLETAGGMVERMKRAAGGVWWRG